MERATAAAILVDVRALTKTYQQSAVKVDVLRGVDLSICSGEFAAIVGPSGSGKTTLLNLIGALDRPSSGSIHLAGAAISSESGARLAQLRLHKIGFVFQDFNLLPVLSAIENVEYVLLLQGIPAMERRKRANEVLIQLGLDGCQHRRPAQLSGGQQQRVAVARALAGNPLLILADEPTANLDSATGEALLATMKQLNVEQGTTFLFSTHDSMVMRHASRIIALKDGQIVEARSHAVAS